MHLKSMSGPSIISPEPAAFFANPAMLGGEGTKISAIAISPPSQPSATLTDRPEP
jgi:hypothetical protein